jgi:hypothetical protein
LILFLYLFTLDADDHRLFCGDLGNEVNDEVLTKAFTRFATFNMARVSIFCLIDKSVTCSTKYICVTKVV